MYWCYILTYNLEFDGLLVQLYCPDFLEERRNGAREGEQGKGEALASLFMEQTGKNGEKVHAKALKGPLVIGVCVYSRSMEVIPKDLSCLLLYCLVMAHMLGSNFLPFP